MAAVRSKAQVPVGSTRWVLDERQQVAQFIHQEAEDFVFSARNELDWLNEHMAEIFSSSQLNITEVFKTPGKLRGKTPRTTRKQNPLEVRAPLSDIFSTNARSNFSPSRESVFSKQIAAIQTGDASGLLATEGFQKTAKENTDSGYHGITDDEMDIDVVKHPTQVAQILGDEFIPVNPSADLEMVIEQESQTRKTIEGSTHSDEEDMLKEHEKDSSQQVMNTIEGGKAAQDILPLKVLRPNSPSVQILTPHAHKEIDNPEDDKESLLDEDPEFNASRSPSDGSSPAKSLLRKSSLTFASLPAREPLTTNKSIGTRVSRTSHLDQSKTTTINSTSYLGRYTGGKSLGGSRQPELADEADQHDAMELDEKERPKVTREESDRDGRMAKLHNKSSTQRLHERINALGKSQPVRPTKSIPSHAPLTTQPSYPELAKSQEESQAVEQVSLTTMEMDPMMIDEDDDDWIKPPLVQNSLGHKKSASTSTLVSPTKITSRQEVSPKKPISVSNPGVCSMIERNAIAITSTTPTGTPSIRVHIDGPLSASKSKLQSIMKSARGLFTSSAGVSAQAKMETLTPSSIRTRGQAQASSIKKALGSKPLPPQSNADSYSHLPTNSYASVMGSPSRKEEGRRTRGSTEREEKKREKEARERRRLDEELERAREKERQKAATFKEEQTKVIAAKAQMANHCEAIVQPIAQSPTRKSPRLVEKRNESCQLVETPEAPLKADSSRDIIHPMAPPPPRTNAHQSQPQKQKELRRPTKPAKEVGIKPKPQPVAIKVGTLSWGFPLTNAALSMNIQEPLPSNQSRQANLVKKASSNSLQASVSNGASKTTVASNSAKPKALLAAERKKEQDEKEAQRKLDQKREMDRKRAAQQEEAQRREQRQRQELERLREKERLAAAEDSKKAAQKQAIEKRRLENARKEHLQNLVRPGNDLGLAAPQKKPQPSAGSYRAELGAGRPQARLNTTQDYSRSTANQPLINPTKPAIKRVFEPDSGDEHVRPARVQGGQLYQQGDLNKRRRTEDEESHDGVLRPTMNVPPIRQSNARKLIRPVPVPNDMAKFRDGRIPFADAPNPPAPNSKTPLPTKQGMAAPAKSSPIYPNGDSITLEEIATDSEDEDSEDERAKKSMLPAWVHTPEIQRKLLEQEDIDTDALFGPVVAPNMEEIFKDKSRHHRFRSRTSSANWSGQDRLTEEEIANDNAARERLRKAGGWFFGL